MPCSPEWEATLTGPGNTQEDILTEAPGAMAGFGELGEEGQTGQIEAQTSTGRKGLWAGTGWRWGQHRAQKVEVTVGDLGYQTGIRPQAMEALAAS